MEDRNTFKKIRKVLEFVWTSPYSSFYRDKYKEAGIDLLRDINSMEDFKKLPYLTRAEIVNSSPYERFFLPKRRIKRITVSSGTTGGDRPLIIFKEEFPAYTQKIYLRDILKFKIKVSLFLSPVWLGQNKLKWYPPAQQGKILNILADINNFPLSAKIASELKIDSIESTPTILYFFTPFLKKEYNPNNIKFISLTGEYCSIQKLDFFKKTFKNAYFRFLFASSESDLNGFRCDYLNKVEPRFFHPLSNLFYYEVINPKEGEELALTHLHTTTGFPVIRYKTGNSVKIVQKNCPCGQIQEMEVLGKLEYDVAKIHGTIIYASEVYRSLLPFKKYLNSLDWKMHVFEETKEDKIKVRLKIQLIPKKEKLSSLNKILKKGISDNLRISTKFTLSQLIDKGAFLPLEVEFIDSFPFSLKQKHIISHIN